VNITCSQFDVHNTTAVANFAEIDGIVITATGILIPAGFTVDYVLLSVFALDVTGAPIIKSFELHFGTIDMPVLVLDPAGQPAAGVAVTANATAFPGVGESCTTDATGKCTLTDLSATTIGLVARTADNAIGVNGLAATTSLVTIQLIPFLPPTNSSSFDVANGTSGWTGGITQSMKIKRDTTLVVATNGQFDLQTAGDSFPVHPFTKTVFVKYKFITSEVPGGFFG
jgi:CubicO group peptidase (beta-lactamase class C family)